MTSAACSSRIALTATLSYTSSVDGHEIHGVSALTMPDRPDGANLGGIVGVDLMLGRLAVLDFGCRTAALLPMNSPLSVAGPRAQPVRAGSIPGGQQLTLAVTVNGAPGLAVLDSGSRSTIINMKFASAANLDLESPAFHCGEPARGATRKAVSSLAGPIGTVRFAGITRKAATARIVDLPFLQESGLSNTPVMTLGLDLLQGTRVTVSYSARRFWVAPSRCPPAP